MAKSILAICIALAAVVLTSVAEGKVTSVPNVAPTESRGVGKFCFLNSACEDNLACISRRCQNPCDDKVCASNAVCTATNHRAICSCEKGYEGHPTTQCTMVQSCTYNPDCDLHLSCRYGKCVDSCATDCKNSRKCKVTSHVPDCSD